jgi:signal transduction histidine kinase
MPHRLDAVRRDSGRAEDALCQLARLLQHRVEVQMLLERGHALRLVAERVRDVSGADAGFVGCVEGDGTMVVRHWSGSQGTSLHDLVVPVGFGVGGKVLMSRRPTVVDDYLAALSITHHFDGPVRDEGLSALAAVPIVVDDVVDGVIYAGRRGSGTFGDVAVDAMVELSGSAGVAIELQHAVATSTSSRVEDERSRLALRLHDSVGAALFGIGASVRDLRADYDDAPALLARLSRLEQQVSDAARTLREALAALGGTDEERELATAIHSDCRAFEARTGISARFVALAEAPDLAPARHVVLRRVVREALLNVEKHARAASVVVSLAAVDDGVTVVVTDDGVGVGTDVTAGRGDPLGSGLGLASLREGLEQVAGDLSVIADEDGGTTVRAWVPCL